MHSFPSLALPFVVPLFSRFLLFIGLPFPLTRSLSSASQSLLETMIYEGWSHAVPEAICHLENCSKYRNYFEKLEHGRLDYLAHALITSSAINVVLQQKLSKGCRKSHTSELFWRIMPHPFAFGCGLTLKTLEWKINMMNILGNILLVHCDLFKLGLTCVRFSVAFHAVFSSGCAWQCRGCLLTRIAMDVVLRGHQQKWVHWVQSEGGKQSLLPWFLKVLEPTT